MNRQRPRGPGPLFCPDEQGIFGWNVKVEVRADGTGLVSHSGSPFELRVNLVGRRA